MACYSSAAWVKLVQRLPLGSDMHTRSVEDLARQPQRLLEDAERGEMSLVTRSGEPVMLAVPLSGGPAAREVRLEIAARLYDHEQISLGVAARIVGRESDDAHFDAHAFRRNMHDGYVPNFNEMLSQYKQKYYAPLLD